MYISLLRLPQTSQLKQQSYFLTVLGAGRSQMEVWRGLVSEHSLSGVLVATSQNAYTDRERLPSLVVLLTLAPVLSD